jgi:hypothetical protein
MQKSDLHRGDKHRGGDGPALPEKTAGGDTEISQHGRVASERAALAIASAILFMPSASVDPKPSRTWAAYASALSPDRTIRCVIRVRESDTALNRHSNASTASSASVIVIVKDLPG